MSIDHSMNLEAIIKKGVSLSQIQSAIRPLLERFGYPSNVLEDENVSLYNDHSICFDDMTRLLSIYTNGDVTDDYYEDMEATAQNLSEIVDQPGTIWLNNHSTADLDNAKSEFYFGPSEAEIRKYRFDGVLSQAVLLLTEFIGPDAASVINAVAKGEYANNFLGHAPVKLTQIEKLIVAFNASTQGDWDNSGESRVEIIGADDFAECGICQCVGGLACYEDVESEKIANASFIALAHNMMPMLLKSVRECEVLKREFPVSTDSNGHSGYWLDDGVFYQTPNEVINILQGSVDDDFKSTIKSGSGGSNQVQEEVELIAFRHNDAKLLASLNAMQEDKVNVLVQDALVRGYKGDDLGILVDVINHEWPETPITVYCEEDPDQKTSEVVAMLEGLCDKALAEGVIAQVESDYIVGVVRSACSKIREITVSAANEADAQSKALEGAGDYTYSEGDADYLVETVRKV